MAREKESKVKKNRTAGGTYVSQKIAFQLGKEDGVKQGGGPFLEKEKGRSTKKVWCRQKTGIP